MVDFSKYRHFFRNPVGRKGLNNGFDGSDTWAKDAIFFQTRIHDAK